MSGLRGLFITGTDTNVGKTMISCALIGLLQQRGLTVASMKPVASGGLVAAPLENERTQERKPDERTVSSRSHEIPAPSFALTNENGRTRGTGSRLRNDDALQLQRAAALDVPYDWINPYCFTEPIAPHIAAQRAGVTIEIATVITHAQQLAAHADCLVVEGVGGWKVPLSEQRTTADLAVELHLPVVLVVGLRLGCINHALLTADSIAQHGLTLAGWIANSLAPQLDAEADIIATLQQRLPGECWGHVPFIPNASNENVARYLRLPATLPF